MATLASLCVMQPCTSVKLSRASCAQDGATRISHLKLCFEQDGLMRAVATGAHGLDQAVCAGAKLVACH